MNSVIRQVNLEQQKEGIPDFRPGDTLRLQVRVAEGSRQRVQRVEGVVLKRNDKKMQRSVTLRSVLSGVGVERSFLLDSPLVEKIEVVRRGKARRARLYYLRQRAGKAARVKERRREAPSGAPPATAGGD